MPHAAYPYLERRPTGYYFRRRLPVALSRPSADPARSKKNAPKLFVCLSLETHFVREAKNRVCRLTAISDALFAARTATGMPISAKTIVTILRAVRDQEIRRHERARAMAPARTPSDICAAQHREAEIQAALRQAIVLGEREPALNVLKQVAEALHIDLDLPPGSSLAVM